MKRTIFYLALSVTLLLVFTSGIFAQEKKPFPAYIEVSFPFLLSDQGFMDSYETNITFRATGKSNGTTEIEELQYQTLSLGWKFPRKGKIVVTYTDFKEESSDTVIDHSMQLLTGNLPDEYYDPDPFDDDYPDGGPANYLLKLLGHNLEVRTRLFDAVFTADFGKGKRFGGSWNAGVRLAKHEQQLPMGYWYSYIDPEFGFSYSLFDETPLLMRQESSFIGPKGGGEAHLFLFNKRLILSAGIDISLGIGNIKVPTQYLPRRTSYYDEEWNFILVDENFPYSEKKSKNPFFSTFDANVKFRIFKELYAFVGYKISTFRDIYMSPTIIELPTARDVAPYGLFVSFSSEDLTYETPYFGVSYQF